jgi:hypothetical protein
MGGRDHLSHRLSNLGFSKITTAVVLWSGSGISSAFSISIYFNPGAIGGLLILVYFIIWGWAFLFFLQIATPNE